MSCAASRDNPTGHCDDWDPPENNAAALSVCPDCPWMDGGETGDVQSLGRMNDEAVGWHPNFLLGLIAIS